MQVVDLHFIGHYVNDVGPAALSGVGMVNSLQGFGLVIGFGFLAGLEYRVPHALGEGKPALAQEYARVGAFLAVALALIWMAVAFGAMEFADSWGLPPDSIDQAKKFQFPILLSLPSVMLFMVTRIILQATGRAQMVTFALVGANVLNVLLNLALVSGPFGWPRFGVVGSAWATFFSRTFLLALVALPALRALGHPHSIARVSAPELRRTAKNLLRVGTPVAGQMAMEVGFFSLSTFLAARLGSVEGAAHQITLQVASTTFMLPLGMSSAAALMIARALGEGDLLRARLVARVSLFYPAVFMAGIGIGIYLFATPVARFFTEDPATLQMTPALFAIAAAFQVFDCTQAIGSGVYRGFGRTRDPFLANLVGHWLIGLPMTWVAGKYLGLGLPGIWLGLCTGLAAVAGLLVYGLRREIKVSIA